MITAGIRTKQIPRPHGDAGWGGCYFCGREITARRPLTIWIVDDGAAALNWTDLHAGGCDQTATRCDQVRAEPGNVGWARVGAACARKHGLGADYLRDFGDDG